MRIYKSTPTNVDMFNKYAPLVKVLFLVSIFAQLLSAATESGKVYAPTVSKLQEITPNHAVTMAIIFTIITVLCLESGIRILTPYSVRVFTEKRYKGPDLIISILIIPITIALYSIGIGMSFTGSKDVANVAIGEPDVIQTTMVDSMHQAASNAINVEYNQLKSEAEAQHQMQVNAIKATTQAKVSSIQQSISGLKAKETSGNLYTTAIQRHKQRISDTEANAADEIALLTKNLTEDLKDLRQTRKADLAKVDQTHQTGLTEISNDNKKADDKNRTLKNATGSGLGYLTIIMQLLVLVYITINEVMNKHAGIKTRIEVSQSYFEESFFVSLSKSIFGYIGAHARKVIVAIQKATPNTPAPVAPPTLIDHAGIAQQMIVVKPQERKQIGYEFYTNTTGDTFIAQKKSTKSGIKSTKVIDDKLQSWQLKQRLKFYKKNVGKYTQKKIKLQKAGKDITQKLEDAISNNKEWVKAYEDKITLVESKS